jgi:hypothetical protein
MRCSIFWVDRLEKIPNTTSTKILEPQRSAKTPSTPWNPCCRMEPPEGPTCRFSPTACPSP